VTPGGRAAGQLSLLSPLQQTTVVSHPTLVVVIPCSKRKVASGATASRHDLDQRRASTHRRLAALAQPARELYAGRAYLQALAAVDGFRSQRPDLPIALHIASAGYGIVDAHQPLVPYDAVLGSGTREWRARGQFLRMPERAQYLIESCEFAIFALSQPYHTAAAISTIDPSRGSGIVIGASTPPRSPRLRAVSATRAQARAFGTTEREVGSVVLARLLHLIAARGLSITSELPLDPLEWPAT
jgi:hypothetical protein